MNLIGEKQALSAVAEPSADSHRRFSWYLTAVAFPAFVVLSYGGIFGPEQVLAIVLMSTVSYFAAIYFFYGLAELAWDGRTYLLWGTAVAAYVLGYMAAGLDNAWIMLTGCSMFLFGGVLTGRLAARGVSPGRVYLIGAAAVVVFLVGQYFSLWGAVIEAKRAGFQQLLEQLEWLYQSGGASPEEITDALLLNQKLLDVMARLFPAFTVLGVLVEFSLGFLVFALVVNRRVRRLVFPTPFAKWRVPFGFTPVVALTILARFLGTDMMQLAADNVLAVLAVYYSVAGLALIEYYMCKLALSGRVRAGFYLLLTLTPFVPPHLFTGPTLLAILILLGFTDSFANWRREAATAEAT